MRGEGVNCCVALVAAHDVVMRAVKFSAEEMQRFVDRQRQQLEQLLLPLRPILAPVDDAYPACLTRWSLPTESTESLSFAAGARPGLPQVTVDNRPAGVPVPASYRPAPPAEETQAGSVIVNGLAWPARVHHQADDRIYVLDIHGTGVVVAANGRRSPDRIQLHRVADLEPYRRRTLELNQQDPDESREWQNPDAWEKPPDTTARCGPTAACCTTRPPRSEKAGSA